MNTNYDNKLKSLYSSISPGKPIMSSDLVNLGISSDLAVYYVKAGWLERLANGVYLKPQSTLEFKACINVLQKKIKGLHIGGKSALEQYGIRHYLSKSPTTHLYSWDAVKLPDWFASRYNCKLQRKRIFRESHDLLLHVSHFDDKDDNNLVSEPERAVLELLSDVGVSQSLTESEEILEGALNLRPDIITTLLQHCTSVKTVRLFLEIAEKLSLPVYEEIKDQKFPSGSASNWVWRNNDGKTLVLKP